MSTDLAADWSAYARRHGIPDDQIAHSLGTPDDAMKLQRAVELSGCESGSAYRAGRRRSGPGRLAAAPAPAVGAWRDVLRSVAGGDHRTKKTRDPVGGARGRSAPPRIARFRRDRAWHYGLIARSQLICSSSSEGCYHGIVARDVTAAARGHHG